MSQSSSRVDNQRKIWPLPGGIHPPEHKQRSLQKPLVDLSLPAQIVLPLSQHIGAPAKAVVSVGDRVLTGQVIAEAAGAVSVPVHAATSGTVVAIEERPVIHPSGMSAPCVVIESDGRDQWVELMPCEDYTKLDAQALLEKIRAAGIAGMGGAGFPAAIKLSSAPAQKISTLIINGTECEPYITADDLLMQTRAEEVIAGTQLLAHLLDSPKEVLIGIEDNKPAAIEALRQAAKDTTIEVVVFPTKYPSGGEKQLIHILTGKEVPSGGLPAQLGIVCQNVGTTVAIYRAVRYGEPLIARITTVAGDAVTTERNVRVRLGTPVRHLLAEHGYDNTKAARLVIGGPMMGVTLTDIDAPLIKTSNSVLALGAQESPLPPPSQACIRCGMCAEACPTNLMPQQLYWYAQAQDYERLQAHNLADCIECGACSFVCPSKIPLVQYYRASKGALRQQQQDKLKSDQSRARFEARKARIEREEAEKEAKRLARKAAADAKKRAAQAAQTAAVNAPAVELEPVE